MNFTEGGGLVQRLGNLSAWGDDLFHRWWACLEGDDPIQRLMVKINSSIWLHWNWRYAAFLSFLLYHNVYSNDIWHIFEWYARSAWSNFESKPSQLQQLCLYCIIIWKSNGRVMKTWNCPYKDHVFQCSSQPCVVSRTIKGIRVAHMRVFIKRIKYTHILSFCGEK